MRFIMKAIKTTLLFLFFVSNLVFVYGQDTGNDTATTDAYKNDITFMVASLQTMFNLLGDPDVSRADKDVILTKSYLKYFKDDKVQIEDDLDPNRQLPMNKNAQAYLQDVVFFFKEVHFVFEVKGITKGLTDNGEVYYKASINRILEGTNLYDEPAQLAGDRYIEFSFTEGSQEYKIVSIYTTKLSEKEDIEAWWNMLDKPWRNYFADRIIINDSLNFDSLKTQEIAIYTNDTLVTNPFELMAGDTFVLNNKDTLYLSEKAFYASILKIFNTDTLIITPEDSINNLNPMEKLTKLSLVNFENCPVDDVSPLRTLLSLKSLDASGSLVTSLQDLQYLSGLEELAISNTQVVQLDVAEAFGSLVVLNIGNTLIKDIHFLEKLPQLKNLVASGTEFDSFTSISKIEHLQTLDLSKTSFKQFNLLHPLAELQSLSINETPVTDLSGISEIENLNFLSINGTAVSSLEPIESIETINMVYCDNSKIDEKEVKRFISIRPDVLVIYETESLLKWWGNIDSELKGIILEKLDSIPDPPDTETLHSIIFTEKVDLTGYADITSLESLEQLINVREVYLSGTNVSDLGPLSSLIGITMLDVSNTKITDVEALRNLKLLHELNIENTGVSDLSPLALSSKLKIIRADNSGIKKEEVEKFRATNSALVLYQSEYLLTWWDGLNKKWKKYLNTNMKADGLPTGEDLQRLVNLDSLEITETYGITDIEPLKEFKGLKYLKMDQLKVIDLSPLNEMITLTDLTISGGPVKDFSVIPSLYNLESLDLSATALNDLEFIIQLPNLERLSIQATAIDDVKPLTLLKKLEYLDISYTKVKKLKPLKDATQLKELKCTNTAISPKEIEKFKKSKPGLKVTYY